LVLISRDKVSELFKVFTTFINFIDIEAHSQKRGRDMGEWKEKSAMVAE